MRVRGELRSGSREHRTSSACGGVVGHDALYERLQSQFGARDRHLINEQIGIGAIFDDVERTKLGLISQKGKLADAIRYALSRWEGLTRFLDDGRIELDNSPLERSIRPIILNRKNALFAGSDGGAEHCAVIASLIETCKLNDVDPLA